MSEAAKNLTDETTETPKRKPETKTIIKEFSFQLFDVDLAKKARRLGELRTARDSAQASLDCAKAEFKIVEAQIEAEASEALRAINTGREMRSVWCVEVLDVEHGRVYWVPKTDEQHAIPLAVLGERPLTNEERQLQMDLDEKATDNNEEGK